VLVDIAIRALSPAVNDPTTAVQVLNHIEPFLCAVGRTPLPGRFVPADDHGRPRPVLSGRRREDCLQLAVAEIRHYGATSLQVRRRLRALFEGLLSSVAEVRPPSVRAEPALLEESVERSFDGPDRRAVARAADRQGIGGGFRRV
jgi:uncharacterized membrane protein